MRVIKGDGPCNRQRMAHRRRAHAEGAWVREAAAAYAAKQAEQSDGAGGGMSRAQLAAVGGLRPGPARAVAHPRRQPARPRRASWPCATPATSTPGARRACRSGWCRPRAITASSPDEKDAFFDPAADKVYRHPTFYEVPDGVAHL